MRTVLADVGAETVPVLEVYNKCDRLDEGERGRLRAVSPGALCVSAITGDGRDDLIAAMEARLALDTTRVTLTFDSRSEESRSARRAALSPGAHPAARHERRHHLHRS